MGRKFSIDIPKLKIGPLRPESRQQQQQQQQKDQRHQQRVQPQSQEVPHPPTPESPRTPVPQSLVQISSQLDFELRAACTWVVENYRPSHEIWCEATKPALDYAAIQGGLEAILTSQSADHASTTAEGEPRRKYSYRPDVPVEELFKHENASRLNRAQLLYQQRSALLRADQPALSSLTAESPAPRSMTVITQSGESPVVSKPNSSSSEKPALQGAVPASRVIPIVQAIPLAPLLPRAAVPPTLARHSVTQLQQSNKRLSGSVGTTASSPHTDVTNRLSGSTVPTSAAITPARASKRASSSYLHDLEKTGASGAPPAAQNVAVDGDSWTSRCMQAEIEKQQTAQDRGSRRSATAESLDTYQPGGGRGRERKPVGSGPRPDRTTSAGEGPEPLGPGVQHPTSNEPTTAPRSSSAQRSRGTSVTRHVREYFRPGSSTGNHHSSNGGSRSRKPSSEVLRGRGASIDSANSTAVDSDAAAAKGHASGHYSRWQPWKRGQNRQHPTPEYSRPPSATGGGFFGRRRAESGTSSVGGEDAEVPAAPLAPPAPARPVINLNRELPPLPSLDTWKPDTDDNDMGPVQQASAKKHKGQQQQQQQYNSSASLTNVTMRRGRSRDVLEAQWAFTGVPRPYKSSVDLIDRPAEWGSHGVDLSRSGPGFVNDPSSTLSLGRTHEAGKAARLERDTQPQKPPLQRRDPESRYSQAGRSSQDLVRQSAARAPRKNAAEPPVDSPTLSIRHIDGTAEKEVVQLATVATLSSDGVASPHGRSKSLGGATLINVLPARTSTILSNSSACTHATEYHTPLLTHSRSSSDGLPATATPEAQNALSEEEQRVPVSPLSPDQDPTPRFTAMALGATGPSRTTLSQQPHVYHELDATSTRHSPISSVSPLSCSQPLRSNPPPTRHVPIEVDVNYTAPPRPATQTHRPHAASSASLLLATADSYTHARTPATVEPATSFDTIVSSQPQQVQSPQTQIQPQGPLPKDTSRTRRKWWSRKERHSTIAAEVAAAPSPPHHHRRGFFSPPIVAPVPPPPQPRFGATQESLTTTSTSSRLRKGSIPLLRAAQSDLMMPLQHQEQMRYGQRREEGNRMSRIITS